MHRAMLQYLRANFSGCFDFMGWPSPPQTAADFQKVFPTVKSADFPKGGSGTGSFSATFSSDMAQAIKNMSDPNFIKSNFCNQSSPDDAYGLYVETSLRWQSPSNPQGSSTDKTIGFHNYIHNRFSDSKSPVDMGDPSKNLQNEIFWRHHGWIDARWSDVQAQCNETSANYVNSLKTDIATQQRMFGTTKSASGSNMAIPSDVGASSSDGASAAAWLMKQQAKNWGSGNH